MSSGLQKNEQHLRETSRQQSVDEIKKVLEIMELEDVLRMIPASEGADEIIKEALKEDSRQLFVCEASTSCIMLNSIPL